MDSQHVEFFESLSEEEQRLIVLRDELYVGNWSEMVRDLEERSEGKPYIFALTTKIEEDLNRIEKIRRYEVEHGVDLGPLAARALRESE